MSSAPASSHHVSRRKPLAAGVAAIFALSAFAAPTLVHAAVDWQVTNCKDDTNTGSFRWAAQNANGGNGDTINLNTLTNFTGCTSGLSGPSGPVDHFIQVSSTVTLATGGVTINGPGSRKLGVTAATGNFRILKSPGALTVNGLTAKYTTVNKATASTYFGGCIESTGDLTLNDVGLSHCYVTNTGSAKGGAVASAAGSVTLSNVVINKSAAIATSGGNAYGGAVYANHNITMTDSSIVGIDGANTELGAYVTGGTGSALGGALHSHNANYGVTMSNSSITPVQATVSSTTGGSANGGAIWSAGPVIMNMGSSIYFAAAKTSSTAAGKNSIGGALYGGDNVVLNASYISYSSTSTASNGASKGGGIFARGLMNAKYSYVTLNSSGSGGGIYASDGFISYYNYFFDNSASSIGGAVNMIAGNAFVRGTSVGFNQSTFFSGFDLHAAGNATVTVKQSTFSGNLGTNALYSRAFSTELYNNTVVNNASGSSLTSGVTIAAGNPGSTAVISSNLLSNNAVIGGSGTNDFRHRGAHG